MRDVLRAFEDEIARIETYVTISELTIRFGNVSTSVIDSQVSSFQANVRAAGSLAFRTSFDGALLILAASFEQFAIGIVSRFLDELPGHQANYDELPGNIRESNERATGDALSGRLPYWVQVNSGDLVQNLFNCHQGLTPYVLNSQVIATSARNINSKELADFLRRIDITQLWEQVSEQPSIQSWAEASDAGAAFPKVQVKLNELINDRNNLAHRGAPSIGASSVHEYLQYFAALGPALVTVCETRLNSITVHSMSNGSLGPHSASSTGYIR